MSSSDRPDLVFLGATVETMTDDARPADAVAVRDGRIVVRRQLGGGACADRAGNASDRARRRDAAPRVPGCACSPDRGRHALAGDATSTSWPMRPRTSTRSRPTRPHIPSARGSPAAAGRCRPSRAASRTAQLLDAIVPDRPVFLYSDDGHVAWVNSRALAVAGIDRATPDPADGRIVRDAGGDPTGTLHDDAIDLMYSPRAEGDPRRPARWAARCPAAPPRTGDHRLAGRPSSSPMRWPPTATPPRPAGSPRASSRRSGGGARPDSSRSTTSRRSVTHRPSDVCARTA